MCLHISNSFDEFRKHPIERDWKEKKNEFNGPCVQFAHSARWNCKISMKTALISNNFCISIKRRCKKNASSLWHEKFKTKHSKMNANNRFPQALNKWIHVCSGLFLSFFRLVQIYVFCWFFPFSRFTIMECLELPCRFGRRVE